MRIANHAALGPTKRNVDHGAFPGHPTGQSADFIKRDVGRIADAALSWPARNRVLHPKSGEHLEMAVIHLDRNINREFAVGITQTPPQSVIEVELLGSQVKARPLRFPWIAFLVDLRWGSHRGHKNVLRNDRDSRCRPAPGRVPGVNGQTFRVYERGWQGSKAEGRKSGIVNRDVLIRRRQSRSRLDGLDFRRHCPGAPSPYTKQAFPLVYTVRVCI